MIKDKFLEFGTDQVLTATAASTDVIDTLAAGDALAGGDMYLVVQVGATALDSAGEAATLTVKLQDDSDEAFGSARDIYTSAVITEAACTANTRLIAVPLPLGLKRYLRVYYTVGTENFTGGVISAYLVSGIDVKMA